MLRSQQIPLDLSHPVSFDLADYIVSACNADAHKFIENWASSSAHFGAIAGPEGAGKSHLLRGWAAVVGAVELLPHAEIGTLEAGQQYFIDDINQRQRDGHFAYSDDFLFHTFNWAKEKSAKVLVTDVLAPNNWARTLPDLLSRMATVPVAVLGQPDDELLKIVLVKLFSDKQLQIDMQVVDYMVARMPRSFVKARELVNAMDRTALAERRRITKNLARTCLGAL